MKLNKSNTQKEQRKIKFAGGILKFLILGRMREKIIWPINTLRQCKNFLINTTNKGQILGSSEQFKKKWKHVYLDEN